MTPDPRHLRVTERRHKHRIAGVPECASPNNADRVPLTAG